MIDPILVPIIMVVVGSVVGCVAGLSPAVNVTLSVVIFYPWLSGLNPIEILSFYIGLLVASQYLGSVMASTFGIPGEASSLPAVREGYAMCQQGRLQDALKISALSSLIGGVVAVIMVCYLIWILTVLQTFYSLIVQSLILMLCLLLTSYIGNNRLWVNILLTVSGIIIGTAGVNQTRNSTWFTEFFSITDPYVLTGLPLELGFIFLYVLPVLFNNQKFQQNQIYSSRLITEKFVFFFFNCCL
jgi:putative tricarboxylic transport membrane protein